MSRILVAIQLDEIIKLKEAYLTGAEASSLLGMRHSHITNLQTQGLIEAHYFGKADKKIRLFKRSDVLNFIVKPKHIGKTI